MLINQLYTYISYHTPAIVAASNVEEAITAIEGDRYFRRAKAWTTRHRNVTVKSSAMERATLEGEHLLDMSTEDMCVEEVPESPKQPVKSAFTPGS